MAMSPLVERQILVDAAHAGNLFQVGVDLLIRRDGEEQAAFGRTVVFLDQPYRNVEQAYMHGNIGLLPFGVDPEITVGPSTKHIGR